MNTKCPALIRCSACNAANALTRRTCDLCGASLASASAPAIRAGNRCTNCNHEAKADAKFCANCGRVAPLGNTPTSHVGEEAETRSDSPVLAEMAHTASSPLPFGWESSRLPGNQILLRRTFWGKVKSYGIPWFLLVFVCGSCVLLAPRTLSQTYPYVVPTLFFWLAGIASIGLTFWLALAQEELIIGPTFLERRLTILGLGRVQTVHGPATLFIESKPSSWKYERHHRPMNRTLTVQSDKTHFPIDCQSSGHSPGEYSFTDSDSDPIFMLADYISSVTGWPVSVPGFDKM